MDVKTKVDKYDKLRFLVMIFLIISIVAFFLIAFRQIDSQLQKFNRDVLRAVNAKKAQYVQDEFNDLERLITLMSKSIESNDAHLISLLIETDSLSRVISSYVFWDNEGVLKASSKQRVPFSVADLYTKPVFQLDTMRYLSNRVPQIEIYRKHDQGVALFIVDLYKVHDYFKASNVDGRTYFELYDQYGTCLIHPDSSQIGSVHSDRINSSVSSLDTIIQSEFLRVPSVRNVYSVDGLFSNAKLFVYAPLAVTDVEVRDIGGFSFLLSISAILLMLVLLFLLNRERRRSERLAMNNLAYQKEEALLRFENLKRKVDPHFLFNALGSLQQLIGKDPSMAKTFVGKMSRVYRKFLNGNLSGLTNVREELILAQEYFFLQKVRFAESILDVDFNLPSELLTKQIPRYSMQIALENAIKHNEFSIDKPLEIVISFEDDIFCISNTFRPREMKEESNGYGLSLIAHVYDYYQVKGFSYGSHGAIYRVCLPVVQVD